MVIDHDACDAFWREYLAHLPAEHLHHSAEPDAFGFGGEPALADELAGLVIAGKKRATTSLPIEFTFLGEPLPRVSRPEHRGSRRWLTLVHHRANACRVKTVR
jgi:hypothetical protein